MAGNHLTGVNEDERQRNFFTEDNEGNEGPSGSASSKGLHRLHSFVSSVEKDPHTANQLTEQKLRNSYRR